MSQVQRNQASSVEIDEISEHLPFPPEEGSIRRGVPLWRNRDYILLWSGQMISSVGTQVSQLAFPLLVLAITFSPAQAGIIGALRSLPFALFCLPAGALVDRWNRKKVMILCDLGRALALGSIPLAFWLHHLTLLQLYVVALVEGVLFTFFSIADATSLPHVVSQEQIAAATAQDQTIQSVSWLLGPLLGGILYGLGRFVPFLLDALSYVCSVLGLLFIRVEFQEERTVESRRIWLEIGEGLRWLWHEPLLRFQAILMWGLLTPSIGYILVLIALGQMLHLSSTEIGIILAWGGAGSIVGSFLAGPLQKRIKFGPLMIGSAWLWAVTWLCLAVAINPLILGIATAISFVIVPIYLATQASYRLIVVPDALQGRVSSVFRLISYGSQPVGLLLTGLLIQWIGPLWAILVLFVPQGIFAVIATCNGALRKAPFLRMMTVREEKG